MVFKVSLSKERVAEKEKVRSHILSMSDNGRARGQILKSFLLVKSRGRLLVHNVISMPHREVFVRPPGGHVEYGETATSAIRREMREELKTGISGLRQLGVMENIFRYKGRLYHEIDFIFTGRLTRGSIYRDAATEIREQSGRRFKAFWVPLKGISKGKNTLIPGNLSKFIRKAS